MNLIKIDRASIKRNPNAGRDHFWVRGPMTATFKSDGPLPESILSMVDVTTEMYKNGKPSACSGYIKNPNDIEKVLTDVRKEKVGMEVFVDKNLQRIDHQPEPSFIFSYENPLCECSDCGTKVLLSEILPWEYCDSGYQYDQCPRCQELNTFDLKYEKISDALKTIDI